MVHWAVWIDYKHEVTLTQCSIQFTCEILGECHIQILSFHCLGCQLCGLQSVWSGRTLNRKLCSHTASLQFASSSVISPPRPRRVPSPPSMEGRKLRARYPYLLSKSPFLLRETTREADDRTRPTATAPGCLKS